MTGLYLPLSWPMMGLLLLALAVVLWIVLRRRRPAPDDELPQLQQIDLPALGDHGPVGLTPTLTLYHQPVRLVLVVIAPAGRDHALPPVQRMPELVESLIPGLMNVLSGHQPQYHPWPAQLSVSGFGKLFAKCAPLPGRHGKGTEWVSVSGPFEFEERRYLAGLVLRGEKPNSLGELEIQHPGQWLDLLRIT